TVTALTDAILESPETVNLVLFGGNVGSNPSLLTINDVVAPTGTTPTATPTPTSPSLFQFAQPNYTVAEGGVATINVTRTGDTAAASINFTTLDGSASSAGTAADYTTAAGTLNFAAGQTTASFPVTTLSDITGEPPETVNLVLLGGNVSGPPSILTINDVAPTGTTTTATPTLTARSLFQFAQPNYTVAEGGVAPTSFFYGSSPDPIIDGGYGVVTINRAGNTSVSASVDYLIADPGRQPRNNVDYTIVSSFSVSPTGGTVNFNPGQTTVSLTINNLPELTGGVVNLGFGPGSIGAPASNAITLI
ncbi:Calx-beta domain-containing protein, partial [Microcoleus sp. MON1_C5]|uniref:Calx-beta domain-containing protein n=1 Tax=Microcoleus sp. MON1_C5 TaxID=2818828 RepID=UPI002FD582BA